MSPERVFQILSAGGLLTGGWLYGNYWKNVPAEHGGADAPALRAQNTELSLKNEELKNEIAQVRSMLRKGDFPVPSELISWIEKEHGMSFQEPPKIRYASLAALQNAAERNFLLVHGRNQITTEEAAWKLLGLLPPGESLLGLLIKAETTGVRGIFDYTRKQILLAESFDPIDDSHKTVLVRLLGQCLSFQTYPAESWPSRDIWQAWLATHQGAAASLQAKYYKLRTVGLEEDWVDPEIGREEMLAQLPAILQGLLNFPFLQGNDYAKHHYLDSRKAWRTMFREPAQTTSAIIRPDAPAQPFQASFLPGTPWTNNLGELGLKLWLDPYLNPPAGSLIAQDWTKDHYQIESVQNQTKLTWTIQMSSADAARNLALEVENTIIPELREMQGDRLITVTAANDTVTFVNAPDTL